MALPNSRNALKEYCLRNLGKPVIDINVDDDQVEDRLDEALQYFARYHYEGVERMYLKYKVTAADVTRMTTDVDPYTTSTKGVVQDNIELEEGTSTTGDTTGDLLLEDGFKVLDETSTGATTAWTETENYLVVPSSIIVLLMSFPFQIEPI